MQGLGFEEVIKSPEIIAFLLQKPPSSNFTLNGEISDNNSQNQLPQRELVIEPPVWYSLGLQGENGSCRTSSLEGDRVCVDQTRNQSMTKHDVLRLLLYGQSETISFARMHGLGENFRTFSDGSAKEVQNSYSDFDLGKTSIKGLSVRGPGKYEVADRHFGLVQAMSDELLYQLLLVGCKKETVIPVFKSEPKTGFNDSLRWLSMIYNGLGLTVGELVGFMKNSDPVGLMKRLTDFDRTKMITEAFDFVVDAGINEETLKSKGSEKTPVAWFGLFETLEGMFTSAVENPEVVLAGDPESALVEWVQMMPEKIKIQPPIQYQPQT